MKKIYLLTRKLASIFYKRLVVARVGAFTDPLIVNGFSIVNRNVHLGRNVSFNGMKILGRGHVHIGDNFHSGVDCMMITENHNYQGSKIPYDESVILKTIKIGDNVWFGNRVMVLGNVTIGEGAIVQAGSVVVSDVPPLSIVGGNPAKQFSSRDARHYYDLKQQGQFH